MKKRKAIYIIILLLILGVCGGITVKKLRGHGYFSAAKNYIHYWFNKPDFSEAVPLSIQDDAWYQSDTLIAHAMGGINESEYTNSKEALEQAIQNGYKVIEVDFSVTSDGRVVCTHDFSEFSEIPDYDTFMLSKIKGQYTPISIEELVGCIAHHPDLFLMTDFKWDNSFGSSNHDVETIMNTITDIITSHQQPDLFEQIIIQVYSEDNYVYIANNYPYTNYVYTLYNYAYPIYEDIAATCLKYQIPVVTMSKDRVTEEHMKVFDKWNIKIFSHTVNDLNEAKQQFTYGVTGIYTDWILPNEMEQMHE